MTFFFLLEHWNNTVKFFILVILQILTKILIYMQWKFIIIITSSSDIYVWKAQTFYKKFIGFYKVGISVAVMFFYVSSGSLGLFWLSQAQTAAVNTEYSNTCLTAETCSNSLAQLTKRAANQTFNRKRKLVFRDNGNI